MFHLVSFWLIYENIIYNINRFEIQCVGVLTWWVEVEGSQFFHETRLQFLLSLTPFHILIFLRRLDSNLIGLDDLSYVFGVVCLLL